jgi:hypothetical protein
MNLGASSPANKIRLNKIIINKLTVPNVLYVFMFVE